jgi:hypothetical protein
MATELVAGTSQLRLISLDAQSPKQLCPGVAGELFQLTTGGGGALVLCNIRNGETRGNHAEPPIKSSKLAQKRLEGALTYPSFLWTRRILERLRPLICDLPSSMR